MISLVSHKLQLRLLADTLCVLYEYATGSSERCSGIQMEIAPQHELAADL